MVRSPASELSVLYVSEGRTPHDLRFLTAMAGRLRATTWLRLAPSRGEGEPDSAPGGVVVVGDRPPRGATPAALAQAVRDAVRTTGALVVHAGPLPTAGLMAIRGSDAPVVAVAWGSDVLLADTGPDPMGAAVREVLARASGFVGDARCVEAAATALGLPPSTPRAIFPWGVEERHLAPRADDSPLRRSLGWEDAHVLVAARAWHLSYRLDVLLDAYELALRDDPRLRLVLLGDGEAAVALRRRTAPHEALGRIFCPGWIPAEATRPYYEAADVYVSTVPSDGSSVSLLEAMASALPAIVVDAYGNREWVEPGRTGWRFPSGDAAALAAAIHEAFRADGRRTTMGIQARQLVCAEARWERNVERLFTLYEAVAR